MKHTYLTLSAITVLLFGSISSAQNLDAARVRVTSPDGQIIFILSDAPTMHALEHTTNALRYSVDFHGKWLMDEGVLGFELQGQPALGPGMRKIAEHASEHDETYTIPVGKTSSVRDHYNAELVDFQDSFNRRLSIEVRAYNDGVAFRYIVPAQPGVKSIRIAHELTGFNYAKDATFYPLIVDGFQSSYED